MGLPGIGPYTAAAIAAIAFDRAATPVDGNIERVMSRLYRISEPLPGAKRAIKARAAAVTPASRCGDYAQAVMDLGRQSAPPGTRPVPCVHGGNIVRPLERVMQTLSPKRSLRNRNRHG